MKAIAQLICFSAWIFGWILAQGFWSTFWAVVIPLYGYYLVIKHFALMYGLI